MNRKGLTERKIYEKRIEEDEGSQEDTGVESISSRGNSKQRP